MIIIRRRDAGEILGEIDRPGLDDADLSGVQWEGADLHGASLRRVNFSKANLSRADLRSADLRRSALVGTDLCKADLTGANLQGAMVKSAHFWAATLVGANLRGARVRSLVMDEADLAGADLGCADLRGVDLVDANLTGANLAGVRYDEETLWPASVDSVARGAVVIVDHRRRVRQPPSDEVEAQHRVRVLLRQAFADVPVFRETAELTRDELRHMTPDLMVYPDAYLWGVLPRVLDCLLDPPRTRAWSVLSYLNVPTMRSEGDYASSLPYFGEESVRRDRATDAELGCWKARQCQYFTREQSQAVLEWLVVAKTWDEAAIELDEIDPAIEYWAARAGVDPATVRRQPRNRRGSSRARAAV